MLSIRNLFVCSLLLARFNTFVAAEPTFDNGDDAAEAAADMAAFQQLLKEVDENALHAALHNYSPTKFKHGVFQEDRTALEAVHQENAAIATKLISLARRQNEPNSTTSAEAPATSTQIVTVPPSSSAVNPVMPSDRSTEKQTPVPMPQSSQPGPSSAPASSAPASSAPASSAPASSAPANSPPASSAPANSPLPPTTVLITSARPASTVGVPPGSSQNQPSSPAQQSSPPQGSSQGQPSAAASTVIESAAGGVSIATVVATAPGSVVTSTDGSGVTVVSTVGGGFVTLTAGAPGSVVTSTDGSGVTIVSTVGGGFVTLTAEAPGSVVTTTDVSGITIVSTVGGGFVTLSPASPSDSSASAAGNSGAATTAAPSSGGASSRSITSTVLHTTTLPDGSQSTVTAVTVVPAPYSAAPTPSGTAGVNPATTTTGQPGLQSGAAAASMGKELVLMLGGAIAVAMMI